MKKRLLSILLMCCMVLTLLPTAAFAEESTETPPVCSCETACTADNMNRECPVCGVESAAPQSCGQYVSVEDGTGENSSTEEADDPDGATALSTADQVQAMINALPSAEEITEENAEEVEAQLDAIDKAKENLTAEEIDKLDLSRYNEVATVLADMAGLMSVSAFAAGSHTHCFCGGDVTAGDHTSHSSVTYQPWNGTDSITYTNGVAYVYLTGNATISKNLEVTGGNRLYLCLNGKTLASNGTNKITVKENSHLTISDCAGGGTIKGATSGWGGMCIYIYHSTVDLFGGKLTGGKVTGKGGGGAIALDDADCVLNLYGGEITGNDGNQRGGGIYMLNGTLNIYGGTISGNKSSSNGGAVYVTKGTVNMSGGTISGNTAGNNIYTGYGGAVCIGSGTMNMSGGEIVDNHAYRAGGIYGGPNGGVTITISGGRITENTASETIKNFGAGVMNNRGTTTLSGNPYIRGNYAVLNGAVNNGYANLYYENGKNRLRVENLTEGADIGITIGRSLAPTEGTPLVFSEACDKNYSGYFTSDEGYDVGYNAETKQLELRVPCTHGNGTLQWTTTPTTHEQAWSCCGLVTIPKTAHTWENGKCTVCEYACLHDGGTATCTQKAVCEICGSEYGDFASHSFTAETVDAKYLKSAATCTDKAVYYKSCAVCGLSSQGTDDETTFESGEVDANNHAGTLGDWQNNAEKHWKEYSCCHAKAEEADHVYDNDADADCNTCGYKRTITYTVRFDANGGSGSMDDVSGVSGEYALPNCGFTAPDDTKTFKAWSIDGTEYDPGARITVTGNITVTALWKEKTYNIDIVDKNGNVVSITPSNCKDVLGDGTVSYTPPSVDGTRTYTEEEIRNAMLGEPVEGIQPAMLTLKNANLKQIQINRLDGSFGEDDAASIIKELLKFPTVKLEGENSITNSDENSAGIVVYDGMGMIISGDGRLIVHANGQGSKAIHYNDNGLYLQQSGTVKLSADSSGIFQGEPIILEFLGGELTIQAGTPEDATSGAITNFGGLSVADNAALWLGDTADVNRIRITPPTGSETWQNVISEQWNDVGSKNIVPHYLQLISAYTVTLHTNGGTISRGNVTEYTYGVGATLPTDVTRTGYTFDGWYDNEGLTGSPVTTIGNTETGDKEYWAKWDVNQYTITFDTAGGSVITPIMQNYDTTITAPADPSRTGYTFTGWDKAIPATMPAENLTITAQWTVNQYTITYDLAGGTAEGNPDTYTIETGAFTLKNPTKSGYTFTGWSGTGLDGEKNMTVTIQTSSTGNRTYTAHWRYNGSGHSYSYYTIKATAGAGGSISPSGNVSVREGRSQTFTITPDKGYAVSNVKIDGKSIGAVKSYTFENVSRTHTIEVIFMKANGNPQTGVFVDVATGSYYEDAVNWAVENGITKGTDDTHFSPDGICTRAQAVTFLWRAAGSPEPETRAMPFTDVPVGSYYYDAVLWAVENGITKGTSDTTFSPNMTCSRAQIVTFLWRSEKSPAAGTANPFADVKSTAYYADAVLWAVKENITKGTTSTTFSPNADCTRAQIVTFLWRCKK